MPISLKHAFVSPKSDGPDSTLVQPSNWNAEHELRLSSGKLIGRLSTGTGPAEEISIGSGLSLSSGALNLANSVSVNALTAAALTTTDLTSASLTVTGLTGLVKANGPSEFTNAVAGTDYQAPITGAATTILTSNLTIGRALISDLSGKVTASGVTSSQLAHLAGVTSNIQAQLDSKVPLGLYSGGVSSILTSNLTIGRALISDLSGKVTVSGVTSSQLAHLAGVTSNIQAQLDSKVPQGLYAEAKWHPYNGVTVGDGALGQIYSFPADGAVSVIETPLFSGGLEYRLRVYGLSHNSGVAGGMAFHLQPYVEETASYITPGFRIYGSPSDGSQAFWSEIEILKPRNAKQYHFAGMLTGSPISNKEDAYRAVCFDLGANRRISRVRIALVGSDPSAVIDSGLVFLDKRRDY